MRVRALDADNDFTFGAGLNNYKQQKLAVGQNIQTRLASILGNCFFDLGAGLDWFNYLGGKDPLGLRLGIATIILNTEGVEKLINVFLDLNPRTRLFTVKYQVISVFGEITAQAVVRTNFLTDEDGNPIVTENGEKINT